MDLITGNKVKKIEYMLDIFKGTCEINNFRPVSTLKDSNNTVSNVKDLLKDTNEPSKNYFYGQTTIDGETKTELSTLIVGYDDIYRLGELINLTVKTLNNAGFYDYYIETSGASKELLENLDMIDLVATEGTVTKNSLDDSLGFDVIVEDRVVAHGGGSSKDKYFYSSIHYEALEDIIDYEDPKTLDVYIAPKDKSILDDTFTIATNLKDAGFKIEVDYDLKYTDSKDIDADFLITITPEDIKKYVVKLKDLKTKEEREIMIDNLIEELSFI